MSQVGHLRPEVYFGFNEGIYTADFFVMPTLSRCDLLSNVPQFLLSIRPSKMDIPHRCSVFVTGQLLQIERVHAGIRPSCKGRCGEGYTAQRV
jgi:hypothetical protein